jgi:hypothetical protein
LIYLWKREISFGACSVETGIVDAHLTLSTDLRDDNKVGQPLWVVDLPYEAHIEQLLDSSRMKFSRSTDCFQGFCCTDLVSG